MDTNTRIRKHKDIVNLIKIYSDNPDKAAFLIANAFDDCKHRHITRTSNEFVYCSDCDNYVYKPE